MAQEAGEEMLSRLEWVTLKPKVILDAGCGTGSMSSRLQAHYPQAQVLALDLSEDMLRHMREQDKQNSLICADAGKLPLRNQSVDLIFANFLLPWQDDIESLLREWRRVLRPDGLLMFTAFGPDTLKECAALCGRENLPALIDMHDMGDLILRLGFSDPVLDVNHYTMTYREQAHLFRELRASGMLQTQFEVNKHSELPAAEDGTWALTYEIVFAHTFMPPERDEISASEDGVVRVPLTHLRKVLGVKS